MKIFCCFLNAIDLIYPVVTRTLLAFFGCHQLGSAGLFLYSAYEVECYTERWFAYMPWVVLAALVFSIGIPAGFLFLILKFKDRGKAGDRSVRKAIGWLYEPFRAEKEWWVAAEHVNLHFAAYMYSISHSNKRRPESHVLRDAFHDSILTGCCGCFS